MPKISLRFRIFLCFFATLCIVACSPAARGQATTASLQVTVGDSSGAQISGARAEVLNSGTGVRQTAMTDATGVALFPRLAVGQYKLTVDKEGFSQYVQAGITLTVGQPATANVVLQIGAVSNKITVTSQVPLVDTRSSGSISLIGQKQVVDLPLNGRLAQSLLLTAPGTVNLDRLYVIVSTEGGVYPGESDESVNGTDRSTINYQLDGVTHNDTYVNASLPFPNPDAIQEFALQSSNFSAEFGNAAGGVVNIVSKSGTNQFHGDVFEFLRNGSLNAKPYFGTSHDYLHRNQYGGTLGGPILKSKLFFFGTYQGTRTSSSTTAGSAFVPDAAERTGNFGELLKQNPPIQLKDPVTGLPVAGNIILNPDPVTQKLLQYIPLPNGPNGHLTYTTGAARTTDNQYLGKIDYSGGKNQITGSYFWTKYTQPAVVPTTNILLAQGGNQVRIQTLSLNHTYIQSPTLLFNTTFGWVQQIGGSTSGAPFSLASLGAQVANPIPPEINIGVNGAFSINTNHLGQFNRGDWVIREDVTKVAGKHEFHFGGEFLHVYNNLINQFGQSGDFGFTGSLSGNSLADFIYGRAANFSQGGGQYGNIVGMNLGFFAQDNWRATDALTVNAGLRWDPYLPYYDKQGQTVCFEPGQQSVRYPNAPNGMIFGGSNHDAACPAHGSDSYLPQFGPRVGFAYRMTPSGSRSLRGGFGIYYAPIPTAYYLQNTVAPFSPQFSLSNVAISDPWGSAGLPNPFPAQYGPRTPDSSATFSLPVAIGAVFPRNFRPTTYNSWNLILEQQLGKTSVARLAYVGNQGSHISGAMPREVNPAIYIPGKSTEANTQQRRPYQDFSTVFSDDSNGISNYNGLQASVEKRMNNGLTLTANYTWSKSMDDNNELFLGQWTNPYNRKFDYAPNAGDVTNNFKLTEVWALPIPHSNSPLVERLASGWEINSFTTWQSGQPFTQYCDCDNSFTGIGLDRADYIGGPIQIHGHRSHQEQIAHWFNDAVFVAPTVPGTFGTATRNQIRGPRYFNTDAAVIKNTKIAGDVNLQLRGEAFNAFNNVNFGVPNSGLANPNRGTQITSAQPPRIVQLSAKVIF